MARNSTRGKLRIGELPNWGAGMFPDGKAKATAAHVFQSIMSAVSREGLLTGEDWRLTEESLVRICFEYNHNKSYDEGASLAEAKKELQKIARYAHHLTEAINGLSAQGRYSIVNKLDHKNKSRSLPNTIGLNMTDLSNACEAANKIQGSKREPSAVRKSCNSFWSLREMLTGKQFLRTFELAPGASGSELISPDALFIQAAFQALDPTVRAATIQYELQKLSKTKSKRKLPSKK